MEKIYTIPINEAFDACMEDKTKGCPFCELYRVLQENELDLILGASMMEPDVRIKTNEMGFCDKHFSMMLKRKNRLGLALMLESHLAHVSKESKGFNAMKKIEKINFLHIQPTCTLLEMLKQTREGYYTIFYLELNNPTYITEQELQILISQNTLTDTIKQILKK